MVNSLQCSCGWGSATLFFAEKLPNSKVVGFSNSKTQKEYIDARAKDRGLMNVEVITGDIVDYEFEHDVFDRVVTVEVSNPCLLLFALPQGTH